MFKTNIISKLFVLHLILFTSCKQNDTLLLGDQTQANLLIGDELYYDITQAVTDTNALNDYADIIETATLNYKYVYFPKGDYYISRRTVIHEGCKILANDAYIIGDYSDKSGYFRLMLSNNVVIDGLGFRLRKEDSESTYINPIACLAYVGTSVLENVTIRNCKFLGYANCNDKSKITLAKSIWIKGNVKNMVIDNNYCDYMGFGVHFTIDDNNKTPGYDNCRIINNTFTNIRADGIELNTPHTDYKNLQGMVISNNYISQAFDKHSGWEDQKFVNKTWENIGKNEYGFGIGIARGNDIIITNNHIINSFTQGIHIEDKSQNIVISNNIIDKSSVTTEDAHNKLKRGIALIDCNNIIISENYISNFLDEGISCKGTYDNKEGKYFWVKECIISNNNISNCSKGIYIYSPTPGNIIEGNILKNNVYAGLQINELKESIVKNNISSQNEYGFLVNSSNQCVFESNVYFGNEIFDILLTKKQDVIHGWNNLIELIDLGEVAHGDLYLYMHNSTIKRDSRLKFHEYNFRIDWESNILRSSLGENDYDSNSSFTTDFSNPEYKLRVNENNFLEFNTYVNLDQSFDYFEDYLRVEIGFKRDMSDLSDPIYVVEE